MSDERLYYTLPHYVSRLDKAAYDGTRIGILLGASHMKRVGNMGAYRELMHLRSAYDNAESEKA